MGAKKSIRYRRRSRIRKKKKKKTAVSDRKKVTSKDTLGVGVRRGGHLKKKINRQKNRDSENSHLLDELE